MTYWMRDAFEATKSCRPAGQSKCFGSAFPLATFTLRGLETAEPVGCKRVFSLPYTSFFNGF